MRLGRPFFWESLFVFSLSRLEATVFNYVREEVGRQIMETIRVTVLIIPEEVIRARQPTAS